MSSSTHAAPNQYDLYAEPQWADDLRRVPAEQQRRRTLTTAAATGFVALMGIGAVAAVAFGTGDSGIGSGGTPPAPAAVDAELVEQSEVDEPVAAPMPTTTEAASVAAPVAEPAGPPEEATPSETVADATANAPIEPSVLPAGWTYTLPVGVDGGVEYAGGFEQLTDGPGELAVDDNGGVYVSDPVAGRIAVIRNNAVSYINVEQFGLNWIADMVAADDHLIVLGGFPTSTEPRSIVRIGFDGTLLESMQLLDEDPDADTVSGLIDAGDDRVIVEFQYGYAGYQEWDAASGAFVPVGLSVKDMPVSLTGPDVVVGPHDLSWPDFAMSFVGASDDDRWIVSSYGPRCSEDGTDYSAQVSWHGDDFSNDAEAYLNLDQVVEAAYQEVASTSDGRVFALDTYEDRVEVRELVPQPMGC
ncbi:MAG: hypothetical protein AAFY28_19470 [Actinomycetota bacterium]